MHMHDTRLPFLPARGAFHVGADGGGGLSTCIYHGFADRDRRVPRVALKLLLDKLVRRQKIHGLLCALEDLHRRLGSRGAISGCGSERGCQVELMQRVEPGVVVGRVPMVACDGAGGSDGAGVVAYAGGGSMAAASGRTSVGGSSSVPGAAIPESAREQQQGYRYRYRTVPRTSIDTGIGAGDVQPQLTLLILLNQSKRKNQNAIHC